jgi:hypothetical protein
MALYQKWNVKTGFTFALHFFMLIFEGLGGERGNQNLKSTSFHQ